MASRRGNALKCVQTSWIEATIHYVTLKLDEQRAKGSAVPARTPKPWNVVENQEGAGAAEVPPYICAVIMCLDVGLEI